jgi:hypothetical protein
MVAESREAGIDILKAICIVLVVVWHIHPLTEAMLPDINAVAILGKQAIKFFYLNISLLAVPSFILVSLYLFIGKLSQTEDYWKKRFLRLVQIYVFWVGIQFILYLLLGGKLPLPFKTILRAGGPDLPLDPAIPSIFYYLSVLILCTIWTFLLPEKIKFILSIVIIALSCMYFFLSPLYGIGIDTKSMKNYYIYIPVAYYLYRYKEKFVQYRVFFFVGFLLSVVYEWTFSDMTSAYGRLPVFFGTLSLVSMCMSGWSAANCPVKFLAKYSLGIFALHLYWHSFVKSLYVMLRQLTGDLSSGTAYEGMLLFIITFTLTCASVYLLGKTKLRIYVS